jgi:hypothetical protein
VALTDGSVRIILISAALNDDSAFQADIMQTLDTPPKIALGVGDGTESTQSLLPIHNIVVSDNGNWFLTHRNSSSAGDGRIDVYRTMDGDDSSDSSFQFWWSLPQLNCPVTAVAFLPTTANTADPKLAVAGINFALYTFNVEHRCLAGWSERAGFPVELPSELASRQDFPVRIAVNPGSPSVALLVSAVINYRRSYVRWAREEFIAVGVLPFWWSLHGLSPSQDWSLPALRPFERRDGQVQMV